MIERRASLGLVLVALLVTSISMRPISVLAVSSASIELEGFRWNKFPLKVLVDMNQWSRPDYAFAVHEAVDCWIRSLWTYSSSFNDTTLTMIGYNFYVSNVNTTSSYDVFITFTSNEISSSVVGLTTFKWNLITHEPKPPIVINITTYSGTASRQSIKSVAMHEFGHALGLGHASSPNTNNGPELMHFWTPTYRVVYPSTLDLYALTVLYGGKFSGSVHLPTTIPYEMIGPTTDKFPDTTQYPTQSDSNYLFLLLSKGLSAVAQDIMESDGTDLAILAVFLVALALVPILERNGDRSIKLAGLGEVSDGH